MLTHDEVLTAIGLLGALWAVISDIKRGRITNRNVGTIAVLGLAARLAGGGWASVWWGLLGAFVCSAAVALPYRWARLGGGDAKLVVALGSLIGPVASVYMVAFAMALGALHALQALRSQSHRSTAPVAIRLAPAICFAAAVGAVVGSEI